MNTETKPSFVQEQLKAQHVDHALRGYILNGVLQVLDNSGNPIESLIDVTFIQPLGAAKGKTFTTVQLTCFINLYDTRDEAVAGKRISNAQEDGND